MKPGVMMRQKEYLLQEMDANGSFGPSAQDANGSFGPSNFAGRHGFEIETPWLRTVCKAELVLTQDAIGCCAINHQDFSWKSGTTNNAQLP
eukprot:249170-Pelagomonas_calceolata.AAC.7